MADSKSTKSPAFQFYPKDFLSSDKVDRMSLTEMGAYIKLLSRCWLDGSLPADMASLAKTLRLREAQFAKMWTHGPLHECFEVRRDGRLVNARLECERKVQADYRKRQKDNADARWDKHRNATALPESHASGNAPLPLSSSASASASTKEGAEVASDSPPLLEFRTIGSGPSLWRLTTAQVSAWCGLYPGVDVAGECRRALAWIEAAPSRRKTAGGMARFLVGWLNRSADRGGSRQAVPDRPLGQHVPDAEATRRMLAS